MSLDTTQKPNAVAPAALTEQCDEIDDLLALVGHELRNPLHGLMLQVSLAKLAVKGEPHATALITKVEASLLRYSKRVTMLLELVTTRSVEYPTKRSRVHVDAVLQAVVDAESAQARVRNIEVVVTGITGCVADSDPVLLEEIVDNLLLNAFKHAACSCVELSVRGGEQTIEIAVADNGIGIAPEDQHRIFAKFDFARSSPRGSGSGLGLWIVRKLVAALGGGIVLESTPGNGSRFTVTIPRHLPRDTP